MSRSFDSTLSAGSIRGVRLFWVALVVLTLLLQYASFASAPPAAAVHADGFELDGNTVDGAAAGTDWDAVYQDAATFFSTDVVGAATDDIFKGGGSKDNNDIPEWLWTQQNVQDKDDIVTAYAFPKDSGGDLIAWFGQDRLQTNGDAVVGFWFFKDEVTKTDTASMGGLLFDGEHQVGDILVLADFSNGGTNGEVFVYRWVGSGGDTEEVLDCIRRPAPATPTCAATGDDALAVINDTAVVDAAWRQDIPINAFFEGGINLTALGLDEDCFSSFMAQSRSSTSFDSTASDFVLGQFSLCVKPNLLTSVNDQTIRIGDSVTDTATLSGSKGPVTGTVSFFVCGPDTGANPDCSDTNSGTQVGGAVLIVAGSATSAPFEPPAVGNYCFRAEYTPAEGSKYLATEHTNLGNECFNVAKKQPAIFTFGDQSVPVGTAIVDRATLSLGTTDMGGSITFQAFGPADPTCAGPAAFTSAAVPVSGNGTYGPVSFIPATAGTYLWIASYDGDAKNLPVSGSCGNAGETDTVTKLNPTIATVLVSGPTQGVTLTLPIGSVVHDTAQLTGATPTAGGTVTYSVYTNNTCTSTATPAGTKTVTNGVVPNSDPITFNAAGTFYWRAVYSGDPNNNGASSACTAEVVTITSNKVAINTSLSGQGQSGQHITIQTGNSVTDSATLTGQTGTAGGTVTYTVYSDNTCATVFANAGTVNVTNGVVPNSNPVTFNTAGTFYWRAAYSGDPNNEPATSACVDETVLVVVPNTAIDKTHNDADGVAGRGQAVTYTIKAQVINGPVTNAVVSDVLPAGQTYVVGSQTSSPSATFGISADGRTLTWTYASLPTGNPAATVTYQVTIDANAPAGVQTNVATICVSTPNVACKSDDASVSVPDLPIVKSFIGNTGGNIAGVPVARIGDTLTYTLTYTLVGGPVHLGVITDVVPQGLSFVPGSATASTPGGQFTFISFTAATRTLRWEAPLVSTGGSVTYQVTVLAGSEGLPQPLVNVATIDSDETSPVQDQEQVRIQPPVLAATATPKITLPPTSTIDGSGPSNGGGGSLTLVLLGLGGLALALVFITPMPARFRRRNGR